MEAGGSAGDPSDRCSRAGRMPAGALQPMRSHEYARCELLSPGATFAEPVMKAPPRAGALLAGLRGCLSVVLGGGGQR